MEPVATFVAGTILGMTISRLRRGACEPAAPEPPPPPPMPPPLVKRPKARIFFHMKEITLPLTADGEDSRVVAAAVKKVLPKITQMDIVNIVLKKTPPRLTVEQKKDAFFKPQSAVHLELMSRFKQPKC